MTSQHSRLSSTGGSGESGAAAGAVAVAAAATVSLWSSAILPACVRVLCSFCWSLGCVTRKKVVQIFRICSAGTWFGMWADRRRNQEGWKKKKNYTDCSRMVALEKCDSGSSSAVMACYDLSDSYSPALLFTAKLWSCRRAR